MWFLSVHFCSMWWNICLSVYKVILNLETSHYFYSVMKNPIVPIIYSFYNKTKSELRSMNGIVLILLLKSKGFLSFVKKIRNLKIDRSESFYKQECIPVGCVPAAHWPYARVCFPGGSVCSRGGVCSRGVCSQGGCLLQGGLLSGGGGVCSRGDVVSQYALRQTPPPCEQNDKQVQKYYLGHNFVTAGNKRK